MKTSLLKKLITLITCLAVGYCNAQITGFDSSAYGFEYDTGYEATPGDMGVLYAGGSSTGNIVEAWTQVAGFEQSTDFTHNGSSYSMKANYDSNTAGDLGTVKAKLQTYRSNVNKEGNFDIVTGTYVLSVWFYITGTPSGNAKFTAQKGGSVPANKFNEAANFDLSTVTAGVWTQMQTEITITTADGTEAWSTINISTVPSTDCVIYMDDFTITQGTLSAQKAKDIKFLVYPNPSTNNINITSSEAIQSYKILDILGKTVASQKYNKDAIDISSLTKGVYVLQLASKNGIFSKRIVKK
ncbi:hypothetical protein GCM10022291_25870 [Postechiella marina]|uniref:Secretion system C-terminal sorting domain-containing protein n=1 Tax=Postechiella marina TaxID=943941 RepID=A0ABP8CD28_9FLAO